LETPTCLIVSISKYSVLREMAPPLSDNGVKTFT